MGLKEIKLRTGTFRRHRTSCGKRQSSESTIRNTAVVLAQTADNRLDLIEKLLVRAGRRNDSAITRMVRKSAGHGMTDQGAKLKSFVACVHLRTFPASEFWRDEQYEPSPPFDAGTLHINDMRYSWQVNIQSPFDVVNFCIPQCALDDMISEGGNHRLCELYCPISAACVDHVMMNLAHALLPALARSEEANKLFLDHATRAITAYLAKTYGSAQLRPPAVRGGLASWQEKRAKELLRANLSGNLSVKELAGACKLSAGYFTRAFRQTVGCAPHQWLIRQRVEQAKRLIIGTDYPLCEIALATGFVDQSHFTRVFSQNVNASPAAWRREHGTPRPSDARISSARADLDFCSVRGPSRRWDISPAPQHANHIDG